MVVFPGLLHIVLAVAVLARTKMCIVLCCGILCDRIFHQARNMSGMMTWTLLMMLALQHSVWLLELYLGLKQCSNTGSSSNRYSHHKQ
jgi:hypothetical protein